MPIDHDNPDRRPEFLGIQTGVVVERESGGRGRVKVRIPGLIDTASAWAWPVGAPGGGSDDRGLWWIPQVGAEVVCWFVNGDPDSIRYMPAHWGAPGGQSEVPDAASNGDPDIVVFAFGTYDLIVDTRPGSKSFKIVDKAGGDNIHFNGLTRALTIQATSNIKIVSTGQVEIEGLVVKINGIPAGLGRL